MAISIVINYIFIVHSRTKIDPLTGLGNRLAYEEYLANLRRKNNLVLSVINIDLDDFKSINDIYGHHEGDEVLRKFAKELKDVFEGKGLTARMGGDEFVVLVRANQKEIIETEMKALIDKIDTINNNNPLPYRIKFSYGMTIFDNTYDNLQDLIQQSDRRMYEDKQKKEEEKSKTSITLV